MSSLGAILGLVGARIRARPGRALPIALGLVVATAFAGAVAAEGTIAGDRAARNVLGQLSPLDRTVRLTTSDIVSPATTQQARQLLSSLGLRTQTEVILLNPVRLSGIVVRPAAIQQLSHWVTTPAPPAQCRATDCPVLVAGSAEPLKSLRATGVRFRITGRTVLRSSAPLGFSPTEPAGQPPVLLTGDYAGLDSILGLNGVFRTYNWIALLPTSGLHAWQLEATERALHRAQANLLASGGGFSLTAPFQALDSARAQAGAAPRRLLLAAGGAIAALLLFVALAAGGLRRDVEAELVRLRSAGATTAGCVAFVAVETAVICAAAMAAGALLAIAGASIEAGVDDVPVGAALTHSLITPVGLLVVVGGWVCACALIIALLTLRSSRPADALFAAAVAALILALSRGGGDGSDPLPILLAPLACLAAGILVFRLASALLPSAERVLRSGPVMARLALIDLARAPSGPSLAIAFIAVSTGLGAFALAYRATLQRSSSDQAANQVPLDATLAAGPDFISPLRLAPLGRWHSLADGQVSPVRRSEASYVSGGSSVTVPALGIPASTLPHIHGWRGSDGSAPLGVLARRLASPGQARVPGPILTEGARQISLRAQAIGIGVTVTADLRDRSGGVRRVAVGAASTSPSILHAHLPRGGPWELEALELSEPTGLEITNGHQNGENPAAATRFAATVTLGPPMVDGRELPLRGWRALGAATPARGTKPELHLRFAATGELGLIRPTQPSDVRPVPVLADPQTAAAAGRGRRIALTVDGAAVSARVVGVLRRFPTVSGSGLGFIVADEASLASALDAADPGQGRPDELWISTSHLASLRRAVTGPPLSQLAVQFREDVAHRLRSAPISRAVLGTLVAACAVSALLAILGLLVTLLGSARDERGEADLIAQGAGPAMLRAELRQRLVISGALGVVIGLGIGAALTRLAVATVRAAGTVAIPNPPIVTVAPWVSFGLWAVAAGAVLTIVAWVATRTIVGRAPR